MHHKRGKKRKTCAARGYITNTARGQDTSSKDTSSKDTRSKDTSSKDYKRIYH